MFVESYDQCNKIQRKRIDDLSIGQVCFLMNNFYVKVGISDGGTHLNKEILPSEDVLLCLNDGKIHLFNRNTLVYHVKDGSITLANTISKYSKLDDDDARIMAEDAEDGEVFLDEVDGELAFCVVDAYAPADGYDYSFIAENGTAYSAKAYYVIKEINKVKVYIDESGIHKTCVEK